MRVAPGIKLTKKETEILQQWSRSRVVSLRQRERADIVLHASEGLQNNEIAELMGIKPHTVSR